VSGIAGEKDPTDPVVAGQSVLWPNRLHPMDVRKLHRAAGLPRYRFDQISLGRYMGRNDAPTSRGERKAEHDSGSPKKGMSSATFQIVSWIGITYDDRSAIVTSLESGADQPPDETVGAITPCHVLGHNACLGGVRTVNAALHTVPVLEQPGEPGAPLDVHPQFPKSTSQHCLDLRLRGEQDEGKFGGGKMQVMKTPLDAPSIDMDPQRCLCETSLQ